MTLTVHTQEDEQRQLVVTIDVAEERVEAAMRQKARELARNINFPGFRRGKVPYNMVVKRFGAEYIRSETMDDKFLNEIVLEVLTQEDIQPHAQPILEDLQQEPLSLKLIVPLSPVVELSEDYREIRLPFVIEPVSDEAVDTAVEGFLQSLAKTEEVERPAELGDFVTLSGHGALLPIAADDEGAESEDDGEALSHDAAETIFHDHDGTEFLLDPEKTYPGTGFVEEIVGAETGDMLKFDITFPADYTEENLAGRQARFSLLVVTINTYDVPELTEELVQEHGYDSIEALRADRREELAERAKDAARAELLKGMIEALHEGAELNYPPQVVTQELDKAVENVKKQVEEYGMKWDAYLQSQDKTVEDFHEMWADEVTRDLERSFILSKFVEMERLTISREELDTAVDKRLTMFGDMSQYDDQMRQTLREIISGGQNLEAIANEVMYEKLLDRMILIAGGNPPDLDALEAEEAAKAEAARLAQEQEAEMAEATESEPESEMEPTSESDAQPVADPETETETETDADADLSEDIDKT